MSLPCHSPLLSDIALKHAQHALDHAWADSTLSKYSSALNQFIIIFYDLEGIPHSLQIPTSEHLLCAFAASRISSIAGSTAESHIAAIKAWHIYNNAPWFSGSHLHYVLNGISTSPPPPLIVLPALLSLVLCCFCWTPISLTPTPSMSSVGL
ncbi:hypothetical protein PAXRUDRAFT_17104 [Paxillus rubicundulus Ve08.2h10]|uniref:Core-binding (CB) domain-containing protein n=1 Tax=Paxillus rubicundulus Ve08.2h10 TaxID=930991 RepID=A0A0D0DBN5_9AGAM|nr:hypothetical protein PAXRUDRAFT_17104 [Paxillus rubicundulus Ve08.2h10]